ncbi:MAG: TIGR02221 family CRISPR-associated protein [Chloroflexota bacterium]
MKAISFLGPSAYAETTYTYDGKQVRTSFFPVALAQFIQPEKLYLCATPLVQRHDNLRKVQEELDRLSIPLEVIPIPDGHSEADLWTIFDQLTADNVVLRGEHVVFDVTHSFRSLPFLAFLAVAYLNTAKAVSVEKILYGAYEARTEANESPVFDLTPFVTLLDWTTAADRFKRSGDARDLASLIKAQKKGLAKLGDQTLAGHLNNLAGALTTISQSLRLIRPHLAMQQIAGLHERIESARPGLEKAIAAHPFALLLENVNDAYAQLAQADPLNEQNLSQTLEVERKMIHWFKDREQWVQAVSLAREWLLSWVMFRRGIFKITQLGARQRIENDIGADANDYRIAKESRTPFTPVFLNELTEINELLPLWLDLTNVRNDIDHAGMREAPGEAESLIERIKNCVASLDNLPLE